jgi:hypothetical protein
LAIDRLKRTLSAAAATTAPTNQIRISVKNPVEERS